MAFIPVLNVAMVELVYLSKGNVCENTLYFEHTGAMTPDDLDELAGEILVWWDVNMQPLTSTDTALATIRCRDLSTETSPAIEYPLPVPLAGTASGGTPFPSNVTVATTFLTQTAGRSFRGRNYFVGINGAYVTGNTITTAFATALQLAYAALLTDLAAAGWTWVVVSRYSLGAPRVSGLATPVTATRTQLDLDSQRRRLNGRGT